ncbi:histidine kinase [Aquincola sp. S2]|uniref:Histidine kinase n=1 Tax=Pseudaquabacterium terrae TaxID=2732868 RepID=A0ABX2EJU3_9BURK|nr:histidine kinase [Aquabacterium terrae]NRF68842.1 histidine kinase [Aquabacterium terrae]
MPAPTRFTLSPLTGEIEPQCTPRWLDMLRHGLTVAAVNLVVGLVLGFVGDGQYLKQIVYSQCIGLSAWLSIDGGRFAFELDPLSGWPRGWRIIVLITGGTMLGFIVGHAIGDMIYGWSPFDTYRLGRRNLARDIAITATIGALISGFYYHRGKTAVQEALLARAERDATLARLDLLRSQLEPHMLFNTLANLRVLIGMDPPAAQSMLDRLIAFLRATLNGSRASQHTLAAEFERLADYLALMAIRMGPRLETRFDLPAELRELPVPPLLLQPLVENAIKHGLEPKVGPGRLVVSAKRESGWLLLSVRDTGVGLGSGAAARADSGFGTAHVRERLAALFGGAASFYLAAAPDADGGVLATVSLPLPTTSS